MTNFYRNRPAPQAGQRWATAGLFLLAWLLAATSWAQTPAWTLATSSTTPLAGSTSYTTAVAGDASGNVFVTGSFTGQITFGNTTLTSSGAEDIFIAKYAAATSTWAWAQRGGGQGPDYGTGIVVSGANVYITGSIANSTTDSYGVLFTSTVPPASAVPVTVRGSTSTPSLDLVVAKYTDNGSSATLSWAQVGGGTRNDNGFGLAVSGTSVYVIGIISNTLANIRSVVFGGNGTTPGTVAQAGASPDESYDWVLAKYTDNGSSATLGWTQVGGGRDGDWGYSIAVNGSSVYVTGAITNDRLNTTSVLFGGTGTTPGTVQQYGALNTPSLDWAVAKYTDTGSSATLNWLQVGGGNADDRGYGIAVSGSALYVTGSLTNSTTNANNVRFGGTGTTLGTTVLNGATATSSSDLLLARYTDNGSSATLNWAQVGGGTGYDQGAGVVASNNRVYVAGYTFNSAANSNGVLFGGTGSVAGTAGQAGASTTPSTDVLAAAYTDNGPTATLNWTQVGGGAGTDYGFGLTLAANTLYVAGLVTPAATFGGLTISAPSGSNTSFLGSFGLLPLATVPSGALAAVRLYPNPAPGPATLSGAAAGATVLVVDALGRRVATATADAAGAAALPAGLAPGLYLVRAGAATVRWVVE